LIRTKGGDELAGAVNIWETSTFNIQKWWNLGIQYAKNQGAKYVAVLNDDTNLRIGVLREMLELMINEGTSLVHADPRMGFGWGHCWILNCQDEIAPDERFTWWYGDHDLEKQAERANGVTLSQHIVENIHSNLYTSSDQKFEAIIDRDLRTYRRKYPSEYLKMFWAKIERLYKKLIRALIN